MESFTISFKVPESAPDVFSAINNVRGWWSEGLEGESNRQGDEFVYRHKDLHYSRHRLTVVEENKKVVWLTTESSINFVDDKAEWTGTSIVFDITEKNSETLVTFCHLGLVPKLACYDACSGGWSYYIDSLRKLITTGTGHPDPIFI